MFISALTCINLFAYFTAESSREFQWLQAEKEGAGEEGPGENFCLFLFSFVLFFFFLLFFSSISAGHLYTESLWKWAV